LHFDPELITNQANPKEPYLYDKSYKRPEAEKLYAPLDKYLFKNQDVLAKEEQVAARSKEEPFEMKSHGVNILKGEELGWFEMGSTIVLIFEGPQDT
jgi:phosphatidylserine decarboxylase